MSVDKFDDNSARDDLGHADGTSPDRQLAQSQPLAGELYADGHQATHTRSTRTWPG
jgi:hypothetical protein